LVESTLDKRDFEGGLRSGAQIIIRVANGAQWSTKRWKMPWKESHSLQFRWEVFNAPNLTRFDVSTLNTSITNASNVRRLLWFADQPANDAVRIALRVLSQPTIRSDNRPPGTRVSGGRGFLGKCLSRVRIAIPQRQSPVLSCNSRLVCSMSIAVGA
jgi:hypothetical protein